MELAGESVELKAHTYIDDVDSRDREIKKPNCTDNNGGWTSD